ncbi:MAG: hypothetical protein E7108_08720 [Bacteroidales bacterium]|jgi:hypothetical protein|nr:hypothetical protein [Bacteroidales bacterium]
MEVIKKLRQIMFAYRFKKAVKRANALSKMFNVRYYVLWFGGKLKVVPKQTIKELIVRKRFKRGTTIQDIEKIALYITE